jgi:hypothetical protein
MRVDTLVAAATAAAGCVAVFRLFVSRKAARDGRVDALKNALLAFALSRTRRQDVALLADSAAVDTYLTSTLLADASVYDFLRVFIDDRGPPTDRASTDSASTDRASTDSASTDRPSTDFEMVEDRRLQCHRSFVHHLVGLSAGGPPAHELVEAIENETVNFCAVFSMLAGLPFEAYVDDPLALD